jgi:predicted TIM-barrel fold metal-dependent hydrolase
MKIDIYTHILPPRYFDAVGRYVLLSKTRITALTDIELRFRIMDKFDGYTQVLTFSMPPIEAFADPKDAVNLACRGNDELAELVAKHPDRFVAGVANLPMNNVSATLKEAERTIKDLGLKGILIYSNINGKPLDLPEFMPLYEMMARYDLPIWIHPHREQTVADYSTEKESKYNLNQAIGWPYETQLAMCRLACSGVMDKYPTLKFITHHCGGGLPFLGMRVANWPFSYLHEEATAGPRKFNKGPLEFLRLFYGDTAIAGSVPALECGHKFFGAEHIVFGTDTPLGEEFGEFFIREAIKAVSDMDISDLDKKKIFEDNAKKLLHL